MPNSTVDVLHQLEERIARIEDRRSHALKQQKDDFEKLESRIQRIEEREEPNDDRKELKVSNAHEGLKRVSSEGGTFWISTHVVLGKCDAESEARGDEKREREAQKRNGSPEEAAREQGKRWQEARNGIGVPKEGDQMVTTGSISPWRAARRQGRRGRESQKRNCKAERSVQEDDGRTSTFQLASNVVPMEPPRLGHLVPYQKGVAQFVRSFDDPQRATNSTQVAQERFNKNHPCQDTQKRVQIVVLRSNKNAGAEKQFWGDRVLDSFGFSVNGSINQRTHSSRTTASCRLLNESPTTLWTCEVKFLIHIQDSELTYEAEHTFSSFDMIMEKSNLKKFKTPVELIEDLDELKVLVTVEIKIVKKFVKDLSSCQNLLFNGFQAARFQVYGADLMLSIECLNDYSPTFVLKLQGIKDCPDKEQNLEGLMMVLSVVLDIFPLSDRNHRSWHLMLREAMFFELHQLLDQSEDYLCRQAAGVTEQEKFDIAFEFGMERLLNDLMKTMDIERVRLCYRDEYGYQPYKTKSENCFGAPEERIVLFAKSLYISGN
ncbi:hypothetical protein L596_001091 [Steinernema carpocapsae]|uniref:Uncharacterized protein n=1 Tax=Steinernema carpocapsae TaxID=34508 RepID=A0A4U8UKF6_STECR|nr:hypothetical protein L596_001091 [Steinernema carpocapsae]